MASNLLLRQASLTQSGSGEGKIRGKLQKTMAKEKTIFTFTKVDIMWTKILVC